MFIAPTTTNRPSTSSFTTTMMLLARALSRTPRSNSHVIPMTIANAGIFRRIGTPAIRGAVCISPCTAGSVLIVTARYPCVAQPGKETPNADRNDVKYPDHATATATFPTAYSRIRSQPMIQAMISPSVA